MHSPKSTKQSSEAIGTIGKGDKLLERVGYSPLLGNALQTALCCLIVDVQ